MEYPLQKKLAKFSIFRSVTKVVACYLLNKHMVIFTIVPIAIVPIANRLLNIPQHIHMVEFRIPHSAKYFHLAG